MGCSCHRWHPLRSRRQGPLDRDLLAWCPCPESPLFEAFRQVLDNLGYVEGQYIAFEHRYAPPRIDQLDSVASELVQLNVDVIVALGTPRAQAAKRATTQLPIVFTAVANPVEAGLVASLARPGGNLMGVASLSPEQSGKALELALQPQTPEHLRSRVGKELTPCALPRITRSR